MHINYLCIIIAEIADGFLMMLKYSIGITTKTLGIIKKELIDKGYLLIEKGKAIDNYFVGRKAVSEFKNPVENGSSDIDIIKSKN